MKERMELPDWWVEVKVGEIFNFKGGGTPSKTKPEYWNGEIPWASVKDIKGDYLLSTEDTITEEGVVNSATNIANPGDVILITRINPGKTITSKIKTAINQDLKIIQPKFKTLPDFVKYLFSFIEKKCIKLSSGTTVLGISLNNLNEIPIPLPPLPEQHRIVAKIEALFTSLDRGIASLKTAQQQLKIYRQAVLKWAFEGKLTNEGVKDGELPEGWKWVQLGTISDKIQIGPFGSQLHKEDYIENGVPLINPMHIQNGKIFPDNSYSILEEKRDSLPNYILRTGDVILGRRGEMGRCGLVEEKNDGWFCGTGSLYIRPSKRVLDSRFLHLLLNSHTIKKHLEDNATGTTMANLNSKIINQIPILIPSSLEEQHQIVAAIESRLSVCDKLEETILQSLQQAEALRQSILKKAFAGLLVPQDPNDEPASVLLERIRAERAAEMGLKISKTKK